MVLFWMITVIAACLPAHSGITVPRTERVAKSGRTTGAASCRGAVLRGLAALSWQIGSLSPHKTHLPKTSGTPQLGCVHSIELTSGDVVEVPTVTGCSAALPSSLIELVNIQKSWPKVEYIHSGQHLQAEKEEVFWRQSAALNQMEGFAVDEVNLLTRLLKSLSHTVHLQLV